MRLTETDRLNNICKIDREFWDNDAVLGGMDEVGRGPLAGPVVVACVIMPNNPLIPYINDSKKISEKRREQLYTQIVGNCIDYSLSWQWPELIDRINILEATKIAFEDAFNKMNVKPTDVLIDALKGLKIDANQKILIHGDALSYSIASASILAKVERDHYMIEQDKLYPEYGFARNKGYGTTEHIEALKKYGPCPIHRKSFIKNFV